MQCRFGFLAKDSFYHDVRRTVRAQVATARWKRRPADFVFDLATDIARNEHLELYRRLTVPTASPEFLQDFEVKSGTTKSPRNLSVFLRELKEYSVTHTLVFAMMAKYVEEVDGRKRRRVARVVNRNLSRLASFVLRTAFVAKFEPSHFEREFANFAAEIACSNDVADEEFAQFLRGCDRSEQNVLDDAHFQTIMASAQMRGNQKVKSLLLGINREGRPDAVVLNDLNCSVEHVLPKGEEHWSGWKGFGGVDPSEWVHRIGNLTLMGRGDNKPGGRFNGGFDKKADVFAESGVAITRNIAKLESWSPTEIERRQRDMAKLAVRVWPFP